MTDQELAKHRQNASAQTMGISSNRIYDCVISELISRSASGSCLDHGAGAGDLLGLLYDSKIFDELSGADLMGRPGGLNEKIHWISLDLNEKNDDMTSRFDVIVSSEVIEHLENPREVFRDFHKKLKPGGLLVVTTPNQQSIRSYVTLITKGHFDQFRDRDYPRHITALLKTDIERCAKEAGFEDGRFSYTDEGLVPFPKSDAKWNSFLGGIAKGQYFSDNLLYSCCKKSHQ